MLCLFFICRSPDDEVTTLQQSTEGAGSVFMTDGEHKFCGCNIIDLVAICLVYDTTKATQS